MAVYFCKCGRQVNKSTNADNTGNRDTAQCTGCPYLLPWGPDKYVEGQGVHKDVQGYECRMSPTLCYTTTYRGQASDKCTLHILSLDLDFLDTVQAWIDDHAADTLSAGFSRGSMRGTDFSDKGRYSLSISCAQNKKGMAAKAAKAALIEQFFTGGRVRKDMTPAQEKARILATIQRGREQAQRKDQPMKKQNDRCPLQQECERTCKVIGHERDCDYYVNNRYSTGGIPDQDEILDDEEATRLEEIEKGFPSDLSLASSELVIYQNDYGTLFAVREHNGAPALMCKPMAADAWTLSGVLAAVQGEAYTAEDLQEVLDEYARAHGWKPVEAPASAEPPLPMPGDVYRSAKSGQLYKIGELTNGKKTCYLTMRSNAQGSTWVPANSSVYPNLSDAQGEFEAWIRTEQLEPVAPTGAAAATTDASAAPMQSTAAETTTTSASGAGAGTSTPQESGISGRNSSPARGCPAEAGVAASGATPAASPAPSPTCPSAFDYTGLDAQTVQDLHLAEREFAGGKRMAEIGLRRMADGVAIAHDALCGACDNLSQAHNNQHSEKTFGRWCDSVGLNRKAAERLLQVSKLFDNSTPREQKVLEELGPSLLYAAAKPSAPAELVQAVKAGDITTNKQYQEALAEIRARDAKINDLLDMSEAADRRAEEEQRKRKEADEARIAAENKVQQYREIKDAALETAKQQREKAASADARARAAENRADGAEKLAELRGTENTELKAKIQEMENQPRDVAVIQPGEEQIEAWRREGADRMAATMQETVRKANDERLKAQNRVAYLQEQLATARPDADACQRTADTLYETAENLRILLRTQLKQAQLSPTAYGKVVAHVLQVARTLLDTVRVCAPDGYDIDSEEDDDFE